MEESKYKTQVVKKERKQRGRKEKGSKEEVNELKKQSGKEGSKQQSNWILSTLPNSCSDRMKRVLCINICASLS